VVVEIKMMYNAFVFALVLAASSVSAFIAPASGSGSLTMLFSGFGKKAAPPAPVKPAPAPVKSAAALNSNEFAYGLVGSDIELKDFDPFQLSAGVSEETILWYRAAELKHSRICMLAAGGLLFQPFFAPLASTKGYGNLQELYSTNPAAIWQILFALGALETLSLFKDGQGVGGDLGWDPLNYKVKYGLDDPSKLAEMQLRELKNGRLAMLGTAGILLQEYQTGGLGVYEQFSK